MSSPQAWHRRRDVRLYLLGHVAIVAGATLMDLTGSLVPMALGASAAIMLTVPMVTRMARAFLGGPRG
jgi:hypothetical protein